MPNVVVTSEHIRNYNALNKNYAQLIGKLWSDPAFKSRLMANPTQVLKESGFDVPPGVSVKILENDDNTLYFPIPYQGSVEMTDEQLDHVAGGGASTFSTAGTVVSTVSTQSTAC